jgi:hypothetical protein
MSGAAISPSMGKETRPAFRFLLGLANVRLGVWVPNPRRAERWLETEKGVRRRYARRRDRDESPVAMRLGDVRQTERIDGPSRTVTAPRPGPRYLLKEMLGWNSVNDPFLYVTDGGHYENLGLVELLRRGCTEIFCFDASGGTSMSALGDAIALARSELEVEIKIDPSPLVEDKDSRLAKKACVAGEITYPGGRKGVLVYARSVVTQSAPYDVQAFRLKDPVFPHHSTADQLYTDQKFEAYRALGACIAKDALDEADSEQLGTAGSNGARPSARRRARTTAATGRRAGGSA